MFNLGIVRVRPYGDDMVLVTVRNGFRLGHRDIWFDLDVDGFWK